jgi:hypothetical protein
MGKGMFTGLTEKLLPGAAPANMVGVSAVNIIGQVLDVVTSLDLETAQTIDKSMSQFNGAILFKAAEFDDRLYEEDIARLAFPLDRNNYRLPIPGELVEIIVAYTTSTSHKAFFYKTVISNAGVALNNSLPFVLTGPKQVKKPVGGLLANLLNNEDESAKRFEERFKHNPESLKESPSITSLREGDKLLEGRFGGSIKFTSTISDSTIWTPSQISKLDVSKEGDPFIVIKNSKKPLNTPGQFQVLDDIPDLDQSSIYLTTTQTIPLALGGSRKMLTWDTNVTVGSIIEMNDEAKSLDNFFNDRYDPTISMVVDVKTDLDLGSNYQTDPGANQVVPGGGGWPIQSADVAYANKYFKGVFPAKMYPDNTFVISRQEKAPTVKEPYPRTWLVENSSFAAAMVAVQVPITGGKTRTIRTSPELQPLLTKAFAEIKQANLDQYITVCGGGLAVRNVTNGKRLSNHSWGYAIDINNDRYSFGDHRFRNISAITDPIDLKYIEIANIMVKNGLTWLKEDDPMHFSIHE